MCAKEALSLGARHGGRGSSPACGGSPMVRHALRPVLRAWCPAASRLPPLTPPQDAECAAGGGVY